MTDPPEVLARIREALPLASILARQLHRDSADDLAGVGRLALVSAARSFDASRGIPFRRWANRRMRGAMQDYLRGNGPRPGDRASRRDDDRPVTCLVEYDADVERTAATVGVAADDALDTKERAARVDVALAGLGVRERVILQRLSAGDTGDEVGAALGIEKSWVSRVKDSATAKIASCFTTEMIPIVSCVGCRSEGHTLDWCKSMNVLPMWKRLAIIRMRAEGASLRTIAREVGASRQTVANYAGGNNDRRARMSEALTVLGVQIAERGQDPLEMDGYLKLIHLIELECPLHPEAVPFDDVEDGACRLCVSDGLKYHHAKRKAEGRPIVPPRRRAKILRTTSVQPPKATP